MLINIRQTVQSVIIIIMIIFKFRHIQTHQMPSQATNPENKSQIQKTNPRPACKVFLTSEVLTGQGRRGTQGVIYKSLAKVSGSDDNVASILVFVFVVVVCLCVSICIWIGICFCICLRNLGGGGGPISCSWWSSSLYRHPSQPSSLLMAPALTLMAFLFWLLNH